MVKIWGQEVGRLSWDSRRKRAVFEYHPTFRKGSLDLSPLQASIHDSKTRFPFYGQANDGVFFGLPAFISDSMPGQWGNTVFAAWAEANHIREKDLTSVDKLSFIGQRGMGALEFEPAEHIGNSMSIALEQLYEKAQQIQDQRETAVVAADDLSIESLYEVGTSAGGQHTKAVIARHRQTGEIRSGQILLPEDYTYYILKFAERDYYPLTRLEMVYADMAKYAGISMMPSELIEIGGEMHFLTERFDRENGKKIHTQTLAAMMPDAHSYEDLMEVCDKLKLPYKEKSETFRRMVFNVLTTNVDAHIRNFSFMLKPGESDWHITPAYDLTFSCFNTGNRLDPSHYLRVNGKASYITKDDLLAFGRKNNINRPEEIIEQVADSVCSFRSLATKYGVPEYWQDKVEQHFAEMNPTILSRLSGYNSSVFSFVMPDTGKTISDVYWEEMGNGAWRLHVTIEGEKRQRTFAAKSAIAKQVAEEGGIKMSENAMLRYVVLLFNEGREQQ